MDYKGYKYDYTPKTGRDVRDDHRAEDHKDEDRVAGAGQEIRERIPGMQIFWVFKRWLLAIQRIV